MGSVNFVAHFPWVRLAPGAPADNRPYAEVVVIGPNTNVRLWCLVDSGADRLTVDSYVARQAGINLANGAQIRSITATGASFFSTEVSGVTVTVESKTSANQDVRFGPAGCYPLLGRVTLLDFFSDVGFDNTGWQHS